MSTLKCPKCSVGTLKERQGKFSTFLGCSTYPSCKYTQNISTQNHPLPPASSNTENRQPIPQTTNGMLILSDEVKALRKQIEELIARLEKDLNI